MPEIDLMDSKGRHVQLRLAAPDGLPSVLAIAFHKSGSVLFDGILRDLCAARSRSYAAIEGDLFAMGKQIVDFSEPIGALFSMPGYVFGVFRTYINSFSNTAASKLVRLILIRDPRDALVSYYFSMRYSHPIPQADGVATDFLVKQRAALELLDIDGAILSGRFEFLFYNMSKISSLLQLPGSIVYRYEDVIFSKTSWIKDIAARISVDLSEELAVKLLRKHDIRPTHEKVDAHVRQIVPGDYKRKLSQKVIDYLEDRHGDLIRQLGYSLPTKAEPKYTADEKQL